MKHVAAFGIFLFLVPAVVAPQARPDFSGTWALDVARSPISPADGGSSGPSTRTSRSLRTNPVGHEGFGGAVRI